MRLSLVMLVISCGAPPPPTPGVRTLELGPHHEGDDVTLVAGAQGGYHVWLRYQMTPAPVGEAILERTAHRVSDDALVLRTSGPVELSAEPSDLLPMFMCPAPVGLSVLDQPIEYQLRFSDGNTELARGAITLTPHCPEDSLELCQRICSG